MKIPRQLAELESSFMEQLAAAPVDYLAEEALHTRGLSNCHPYFDWFAGMRLVDALETAAHAGVADAIGHLQNLAVGATMALHRVTRVARERSEMTEPANPQVAGASITQPNESECRVDAKEKDFDRKLFWRTARRLRAVFATQFQEGARSATGAGGSSYGFLFTARLALRRGSGQTMPSLAEMQALEYVSQLISGRLQQFQAQTTKEVAGRSMVWPALHWYLPEKRREWKANHSVPTELGNNTGLGRGGTKDRNLNPGGPNGLALDLFCQLLSRRIELQRRQARELIELKQNHDECVKRLGSANSKSLGDQDQCLAPYSNHYRNARWQWMAHELSPLQKTPASLNEWTEAALALLEDRKNGDFESVTWSKSVQERFEKSKNTRKPKSLKDVIRENIKNGLTSLSSGLPSVEGGDATELDAGAGISAGECNPIPIDDELLDLISRAFKSPSTGSS